MDADDSWGVGWALGASTSPYIQAHLVELACKPAASADLEALRAAEVAVAKVQWATKDDGPQGSMIAVVGYALLYCLCMHAALRYTPINHTFPVHPTHVTLQVVTGGSTRVSERILHSYISTVRHHIFSNTSMPPAGHPLG